MNEAVGPATAAGQGERCVICCETLLLQASSLVAFDCGHIYHYQCAGYYLKTIALKASPGITCVSCPICRLTVNSIIKLWGIGGDTKKDTDEEYEAIFCSLKNLKMEENSLSTLVSFISQFF